MSFGSSKNENFQGYGLFTLEEVKVRPDGVRLSRGPGAYKVGNCLFS